jgi:hypothetical protein
MNSDTLELLNKFYKEAHNIWSSLCKIHSEIYDLTCDEYMKLLKSEIDDLSITIESKEEHIKKVSNIDLKRKNLILRINNSFKNDSKLNKTNIKTAKELVNFFAILPSEQNDEILNKLNNLLVDIVTKTKEQNKKNQVFINKAILSINEIKSSIMGNRFQDTYNASGKKNKNLNNL